MNVYKQIKSKINIALQLDLQTTIFC